MHLDVTDLRDFYTLPLGGLARRFVGKQMRLLWPDVHGMTVLGLGYAAPYLELFEEEAERVCAFMPAGQGVITWPHRGPYRAALVEETDLPLPDNSAERVLAVHSLEMCEASRDLLRDIWRVLTPEGSALLVLPNRRGLWAGPETTPFGHGKPYSRGQLADLLRDSLFEPIAWRHTLFVPPLRWRLLMRSARAWERVGGRLWPAFSGVVLVEARKQVYGGLRGGEEPSRVRANPKLHPVPATGVTAHGEPTSTRSA